MLRVPPTCAIEHAEDVLVSDYTLPEKHSSALWYRTFMLTQACASIPQHRLKAVSLSLSTEAAWATKGCICSSTDDLISSPTCISHVNTVAQRQMEMKAKGLWPESYYEILQRINWCLSRCTFLKCWINSSLGLFPQVILLLLFHPKCRINYSRKRHTRSRKSTPVSSKHIPLCQTVKTPHLSSARHRVSSCPIVQAIMKLMMVPESHNTELTPPPHTHTPLEWHYYGNETANTVMYVWRTRRRPLNVHVIQMILSRFCTCKDVTCVKLHIPHLVFLHDVSHNPLGAAVLLSGQQPTQWFREEPVKKRKNRESPH